MSKAQKLNFRFHNPNPPEETAEYIYRIFLEANKRKFEKVLMEKANSEKKSNKEKCCN